MAKSAFGTIRPWTRGTTKPASGSAGDRSPSAPTRPGARRQLRSPQPVRRAEVARSSTAQEAGNEPPSSRAVVATRVGHRASTRARDRLILDHDVLPFFGQIAIGEVDARTCRNGVSALGARLWPASVRRVFTLDQLLDAAVDDNLIVANPAARARLGADQSSRDALF